MRCGGTGGTKDTGHIGGGRPPFFSSIVVFYIFIVFAVGFVP